MKRYRVIIEDAAGEDILDHAAWIASEGSPINAQRWMNGIEDAIQSLTHMPSRFPVAPESKSFGIAIRHFVFKSHRVLYHIDGSTVRVLHIRHAARRRWKPPMN